MVERLVSVFGVMDEDSVSVDPCPHSYQAVRGSEELLEKRRRLKSSSATTASRRTCGCAAELQASSSYDEISSRITNLPEDQ